jgi:chromate reductase
MKILGIAGSLRKASYNRGLLRVAKEVAPKDVEFEIFDLEGIPLFNQDLEENLPQRVVEMKAKVRAADALLFASCEYNYSFSGVLKNALDWGSRPNDDNAWEGKPVAIMGASMGMQGTSRAQYHLRQVFVTLDMYCLNGPEVMIGKAQERCDEQGNVTDAGVRERVAKLVQSLVSWTHRLSGQPSPT